MPNVTRGAAVFCCLVVWTHDAASQEGKPSASRVAALPAALTAALTREGCRVPNPPEVYGPDSTSIIPHVAYRANVRLRESKDWVVICERVSRRDVLVFTDPITRESQPALQLNIEWDPNDDGCEGWIEIADGEWVGLAISKERSQGNQERLAPAEARALHAGIVDSMCEGDGVAIRYWTGRRWVSLPAYWDEPGGTRHSFRANTHLDRSPLDAIAHRR